MATKTASKKLNEKQKRFADEFLVDLNATQAAVRAGYAKASAHSQASDLLKNPKIVEYLSSKREKLQGKLEITQERVLQELARIAFFDSGRLFDDAGEPIPLSCIDEDTRRAIVGVELVTKGNDLIGIGEVQKIRLADKKGALDSIARHLGMFKDTINLNHKGIESLVLEAGAEQ